MTQYYTTEYI